MKILAAAICVTASWLAVTAVPAHAAETIDPAVEYGHCMDLARATPKKGLAEATRWEGLGGGDAARHCRATSLLGLGQTEDAAHLLEQLATTTRAAASVKVGLLRQAADAWADARQDDQALVDLDAVLKIAPGSADTYEAKALVLVDLDRTTDAVTALSAGLAADPKRLSSLVLRAAAYRRLGSFDLAGKDLTAAGMLGIEDTDLWLEKGNLALATGHPDAARQAWLHVLSIRDDGTAADDARANLARLDIKDGAPPAAAPSNSSAAKSSTSSAASPAPK